MAGGWVLLWLVAQAAGPVAGDLAEELQGLVAASPVVEVNTAPVSELLDLPFMTQDLALQILKERQRRPFQNFQDFARRIPLDPVQDFVYRQVLRFPAQHQGLRLHGYTWARWREGDRVKPGFRWTLRSRHGGVVVKGPEQPRALVFFQASRLRILAGWVAPRFGLDLLTRSRPVAADRLYRAHRWQWLAETPGLGLEVGPWSAFVGSRRAVLHWRAGPGFAATVARRGVTLDGTWHVPGGRIDWETGIVDRRWRAGLCLRPGSGRLRWALRLDTWTGAALTGRLPLSAAWHLGLRTRWQQNLQETRIWLSGNLRGLRVRGGLYNCREAGESPRTRWFLDLQPSTGGLRLFAEQVRRGREHGWLFFVERTGNLGDGIWRARWSVFHLPSWETRLWLAEPAPGFWPRVYPLFAPGYRGTLAWSRPLGHGFRMVVQVSVGEDGRHPLAPEGFLALRR